MNEEKIKRFCAKLDWTVALGRLEAVERISRGILDYPEDPRLIEAVKILEIVDRVRRAYLRGRNVPYSEMIQIERLARAANDKVLKPFVEVEVKRRTQFVEATAPANERRHREAESVRAAWQSQANDIWERHPNWPARAVAIQIAKETGGNPDTIRRKLSRPSKS